MRTAAGRLRTAMDDAGMSVNALSGSLRERGVRGSSRKSISRYLDGDAPPMEFLRAAAAELDVNEVWLLTGEGPRNDHEAATRDLEENWEERTKLAPWQEAELTLRFQTPTYGLPEPVAQVVVALVRRLYEQRGPVAFGAEWEGEWRGLETAAPEVPVTQEQIGEYLKRHLSPVIGHSGLSYGERVAQGLSILAYLFIREFGSRPSPRAP